MKKKSTVAAMMILFSFGFAFSEEEQYAQFFGDGFSYMILQPGDWQLDIDRWSDRGIQALFYLKSKQFGPETPIFYIKPSTYKKGIEFDLRDFVSDDLTSITSEANNYVFEQSISTKFGPEPLAYYIDYNDSKNFEFIVYKRFGLVIFQFILATQDRKMRDTFAPVMKDFLDTFLVYNPD